MKIDNVLDKIPRLNLLEVLVVLTFLLGILLLLSGFLIGETKGKYYGNEEIYKIINDTSNSESKILYLRCDFRFNCNEEIYIIKKINISEYNYNISTRK